MGYFSYIVKSCGSCWILNEPPLKSQQGFVSPFIFQGMMFYLIRVRNKVRTWCILFILLVLCSFMFFVKLRLVTISTSIDLSRLASFYATLVKGLVNLKSWVSILPNFGRLKSNFGRLKLKNQHSAQLRLTLRYLAILAYIFFFQHNDLLIFNQICTCCTF